MTPAAARDALAAHLTEELDVHPDLAARTAQSLANRLSTDGWEIKTDRLARPVAPRARETRAAQRFVVRRARRARMNGGTAR